MSDKLKNEFFPEKNVAAMRRGLTLELVRREVGRELGMRKNLYPKWVAGGRLNRTAADHQYVCMAGVYALMKSIEAASPEKIREIEAIMRGETDAG